MSENEASEAEIVDNHRLDHLYSYPPFRNGAGRYFAIVSLDKNGVPDVIEAQERENLRSKIRTRLTFIKSEDGGDITEIELKRFTFFKHTVREEESISFSFPYFVSLIGFLQSVAKLNLNDITERRIPLGKSPSLDEETVKQFYTLATTERGQELIRELLRNGKVEGADIVNIANRKTQLGIFEGLLTDHINIEEYRSVHEIKKSGDEAVWQHFFENNSWIFGYGLNYVFNEPLQGKKLQETVIGHSVKTKGKTADGLLKTRGVISSICLVEIKTAETLLLQESEYRPSCWSSSNELSGGIAQAQKTVQKTIENLGTYFQPENQDGTPTGEGLFSYRPKSFLLIGKLSEFDSPTGINKEKFGSFELLRRNTNEPEIITFDELLERAKFIVSNS